MVSRSGRQNRRHHRGVGREVAGTAHQCAHESRFRRGRGRSGITAWACKSDGTIVAWGWDTDGSVKQRSPRSLFVAVAAGGYHSMGLKSDGSIVAWGTNRQSTSLHPTRFRGRGRRVAQPGPQFRRLHRGVGGQRQRPGAASPHRTPAYSDGRGGGVSTASPSTTATAWTQPSPAGTARWTRPTSEVTWGSTASIDLAPDPYYYTASRITSAPADLLRPLRHQQRRRRPRRGGDLHQPGARGQLLSTQLRSTRGGRTGRTRP